MSSHNIQFHDKMRNLELPEEVCKDSKMGSN